MPIVCRSFFFDDQFVWHSTYVKKSGGIERIRHRRNSDTESNNNTPRNINIKFSMQLIIFLWHAFFILLINKV